MCKKLSLPDSWKTCMEWIANPRCFIWTLTVWSKVVLLKLYSQWGSVQGIFLLQNPLGFPAWLYYPITVSDVLGKKKRCQAQVIRLPLMICAAVSVSSLHSFWIRCRVRVSVPHLSMLLSLSMLQSSQGGNWTCVTILLVLPPQGFWWICIRWLSPHACLGKAGNSTLSVFHL